MAVRGRQGTAIAVAAGLFVLAAGSLPARGAACDEYDPQAPSHGAQITLGANDLVEPDGDTMRSFVATGSIGRVEVAILSATPAGVAANVSAVPEISRFSPYYGEALKGIAVAVQLAPSAIGRPVKIVLGLRQVCARYFRNTFLYY